jgi:hypothetical protein
MTWFSNNNVDQYCPKYQTGNVSESKYLISLIRGYDSHYDLALYNPFDSIGFDI